MEEIFWGILVILALAAVPLAALVLGIVAFRRSRRIVELTRRIERLEAAGEGLGAAETGEEVRSGPLEELPAEAEAEVVTTRVVAEPRAPRRRKPVQWELLIGQKALGWAAVVLLVFAAAFFLRYAYQNQWVGPLGRVALGAAAGAALAISGWRYYRRGWRVFSQMLTAGGVIVLYLATYSAFGFYHLLPQQAAAAFLVVIVVESVILALRYDSPAIALTAVIGGLLTPVLMQSERDAYVALFIYLAVLNAGVVLLLLRRLWPAIATVALLGTQALFWQWYTGNYHPEKLAWALGFQAVVYVLYLLGSLGVNFLPPRRVSGEEPGRMLLAAGFWFAAVYVLLQEDYGVWMGSAAVGMAVLYAALGRLLLASRPADSRQPLTAPVLTSLAIAAGFVALALPIQAEAAWVALGWMAVGAVLWWFGLRVQAPMLRTIAAGLAACAVVRMLLFDMPHGVREPFVPVFNKFALPAIGATACLLGAVAATRPFLSSLGRLQRAMVAAAGGAGVLLLWLILSVDCYGYFVAQARLPGADPARWRWLGQTSLSILWAVYATVVLAVGFRGRLAGLRWLAIALFGVTVAKVFVVDMAELRQVYRIVAFLVLAIFMGIAAWGYQRIGGRQILTAASKGVHDESE